MASTSINIFQADATLARLAMTWVEQFYPGVQLEIADQQITLSCDDCDELQLERIWRAALLNEQLNEAARVTRRASLEALLA